MKRDWSKHLSDTTLLGLLLLAGCQQIGSLQGSSRSTEAETSRLRQGFTCCNLHYEGDWINDGNYAQLPMIPAGTPAKVLNYGRYRAGVEIGGKPMQLGQDYGRVQETTQQWVEKIIVTTDPKAKMASYPADVREAIRQGRVMTGMTKEQVIMSVGYPLTSETPSLDSPVWRHWVSSFGEYQLNWGRDGRVKEILADSMVKNIIVYHPANQ